jgi:hypothetical protein
MPRGPKGEKRPADVVGNAVLIAKIATGEVEEQSIAKGNHLRSDKVAKAHQAKSLRHPVDDKQASDE